MRLPTVMLALSQTATPAKKRTVGDIHPSRQSLLRLECEDCKTFCKSLLDPEAVSACMERCRSACDHPPSRWPVG